MANGTVGPYEMAIFKSADGSPCPGVKSEHTGGAVCWASGNSDAECLANAVLIANALNAYRKTPPSPNEQETPK